MIDRIGLWLLFLLPFVLGGCHVMEGAQEPPAAEPPLAEPPAEEGAHYLKAGPLAGLERGPGEETLLSEFVETSKKLARQKDLIKNLTERVELLERERDKLRGEFESERNLRLGAEAERDRARLELKEKNIQLLNLALQKTRSDRKRYELLIAKKKLEDMAKVRNKFLNDHSMMEDWRDLVERAKEKSE